MHVIIIGCGRVGAELARLMSHEGHNIVVVDQRNDAFARLGQKFNGLTLVGNGFDVRVLKEAGIEKANAVCCVTNRDNTNIIAAQIAKKLFNVPKVIARIYDSQQANIYEAFGLTVISGTNLFAAMVRDKLIDDNFSSYLLETGELGMLDFDVTPAMVGKTVNQVNIPLEFLVVTVVRKNKKVIIPDETVIFESGDRIVGVVRVDSLSKVKKILAITE